ncbi:MAG: L,D-transpeptidase [Chlamydiota bacterium]|nr:L,D-transpeptidase [Chlamydiota bacterium]
MKRLFLPLLIFLLATGYWILCPNTKKDGVAPAPDLLRLEEAVEAQPDRTWRLFTRGRDRFPFVETVTYHQEVPWLKGRPAWIVDYAKHYSTSRHFIARSLNGSPDYFSQSVKEGDRFNVFRNQEDFHFELTVELASCSMDLVAVEGETRHWIKRYRVALGRPNRESPSGFLTPTGEFRVGQKHAVHEPGMKGDFRGKEVELIQCFGTRWLSLEGQGEEDYLCGYGLHGVPWTWEENLSKYHPRDDMIGTYCSDGCIQLKQSDIEEIYAIVLGQVAKVSIVDVRRE